MRKSRRPIVIGRATSTTVATWGFDSTGWTTFGVTPASGDVPSGSYLKIGSLTTQTDILATHADGSIRHALVTALIPSTGNRDLTVNATGPGSAFTPTNWPTCVVDMTIESTSNSGTAGDIYRASLPSYATTDRSCSGSQMQETHYFVTPAKTVGGAAHPFLRVRFSVRSYSDGEHEVSVIGENTQVHKTGSTARAVDCRLTITFNGSTVLDKAASVNPFTVALASPGQPDYTTSSAHGLTKGDCIKITSGLDSGEVRVVHSVPSSTTFQAFYGLYNSYLAGSPVSGLTCTKIGFRHWAGTRWVQHFQTSGYAEADQVIDVDHYVRGHAFPKYIGNAGASYWQANTYPGSGPFGPGNWNLMSLNGPDSGTRNDIGLQPGHVVSYLSNPSNQTCRDVVLQEADLAGSYNLHWGVDDSNPLLDLDTYPTFYGSQNLVNGGVGIAKEADTTWYGGSSEVQFTIDYPHMPQPTHAAYILTGRRYYADETKFIANNCMLATYNNGGSPGYDSRGGGAGYVGQFFNAARGHAWNLRNLLCCYFLPDADQYKTYFETRIATNLSVMDDYATDSTAANGMGAIYYEDYSPAWPEGGSAEWIVVSPWQVFYMIPVAYWATQLYAGEGGVMLDRCCKYGLSFYNEPTWAENRRAPYRHFVKYKTGATFTFYSTTADSYADQAAEYPSDADTIWATPMSTYYGPHVRLAYVFGKKIGLANAQAAIDWINAFDNHGAASSVESLLVGGTMAFAFHEDQ